MRPFAFLLCAGCATFPVVAAAPAAAAPAVPTSPVAATTTTFSVSEAELVAFINKRPKLAREYYELRRGALEETVLDRLVDEQAKKVGQSGDAWLSAEVDKHVLAPSEVEIKTFFTTRVQAENPQADFATEGPQIRGFLMETRRRDALRVVVQKLKDEAHLTFKIAPARVQVAAAGPAKGPAAAPVTLVEFSDYECPYCRKEESALQQLLKAYPTQVRLVVRDFPLDMHPDANRAARAAVCAEQQGHFWEMHDRLFEDASALDEDGLKQSAKKLGLDAAKFGVCLQSLETARKVNESQREGEEAGVDGTPALFVNGRPFAGAVGFAELKAVVDEELADAASVPSAQGSAPAKAAP